MVIKSTTAHLFHVGDSRIYRLSGNSLEQLTNDHRVVISSQQSYLGRALGVNPQIEIDYQMLRVEQGDIFVLVTDGIYEHVSDRRMAKAVNDGAADLDQAAKAIVDQAFEPAARTISRSRSSASMSCPTVRRAKCSRSRTNCRCRRCWRRGRFSTATGSSANCTAPAAATSISPSISKPTRWSPSRFRRSICATIRPT